MKIAFSLHPVTYHRQRGLYFYVKYLLEGISQIDTEDTFFLFCESIKRNEINIKKENFFFVPFRRLWKNLPTGLKWLWDYIILPMEIKRVNPHLIHIPDAGLPWLYRGKVVATIHDIAPYLFPYYLPTLREKLKYRLKLLSLKRADRIIAISKSTAEDLINYLHIPKRKIRIIPYGIDKKFSPLPQEKSKKHVEENFNIKENFILYVGALSPNKNVMRLLEAFSLLIKSGIRNYPLLIVASTKNPNYPYLLRKTFELGIDKFVHWLNSQPQEKLVYLYNACTLFVFPSLYEGFGLPPLEAMACGAPVVASNTSSLPEVVGDAGILVNPKNPEDIFKAMRKVLLSSSLREEMSEKALKRAKNFSWKKTAGETLEVYREVLQ